MIGDAWLFAAVLAIRLTVELIGHYADNCKLTHQHLKAAVSCSLCVAVCIPISREVIRESNDVAAVAAILASGIGYYVGSVHYERTKK